MTSSPIRLGPLLLTRPIGQGGMGTVWHARHPEGADVAVKVLKQEYAADKALLEAFRFEVRSVASLDHPSVVRVFDYGAVPVPVSAASAGRLAAGSPWLSMEHAGGGTLGDKTRLATWKELRDTLVQILDALAHSHARDLVHRDLKPRNLLLHADGRITITDFGIAHAVSRVSPAHAQAGTPGYMAPEQIRGDWRALGPWTDLYSLGCLVWRLTTGNPPFTGKNKIQVLRAQLEDQPRPLQGAFELPPGLSEWAHRLIDRDPARRFPCAADAALALQDLDRHHDAERPLALTDWRPRHPPTTVRPKGTGLALFILRPWPLVGREPVQDQLWDALRRVTATRRAEVIAISGPAGVGKSRVARWLAEQALESGAAWVLRARYDAEGKRDLRTAVRSHLRLLDLEPAQAYDRLVAWVAARGSREPDLEAATLCGLLFPAATGTGGAPIVHAATAGEQHTAWLQLFDRLAFDRPLVVVLDDLHLSDDAHPLVSALAGSDRPVVLVATSRRDGVEPEREAELRAILSRPGARELPLDVLSSDDQRRLVDAGVGVTPRLAQALVDRTGGNPLFAVRIVSDWARQGALVPTSTGFDLREGTESRLPDTIGEHFALRLDPFQRRNPTAALALEVLAVLGGQRIREEEWVRACDEAGFPLDGPLLDAIEQSALANRDTIDGARWSFEHVLLEDALVQRASDGGRLVDHHRSCARALLHQTRTSARERAVLHLVEGGDRAQARATVRSLVEEAVRRGQFPRLQGLLDYETKLLDADGLAADHPERLPSHADRALQQLATRPTPEAIAAAPDLLARAIADGRPALCARASRAALMAEDAAARLAPGDASFARSEQWHREADDDAGLLAVIKLRGSVRRRSGDAAGAERDLRQALDLAHGLQDPLEQARVLQALAEVIGGQGRVDEAEPLLQQAKDVYQWAGRTEAAAHADALLSGLARARGDLVQSLERARRAQAALRKISAPTGLADLQSGYSRLARGELAQARREISEVALAPESAPELVLLARGGLLVCAAGARSWPEWDETMAAWKALARHRRVVDPDLAWSLEWAARRAFEAGEPYRAREAWTLAEHRYALVGDQEALERVRQRLRELEGG